MRLLDGEIAALLAGQNADLFTQSRQAQAAFEHALRIAQEIDVQAAPRLWMGCAARLPAQRQLISKPPD